MSMKNLFLAGAAATMLATSAMAAEPVKLTNSQMDDVTAGLSLSLTLALGLTGTVAGINNSQFNSASQAEIATSESTTIGTSVSSLRQAAALGLNTIQSASTSGGGVAFSSGTLAVGGSVSFTAP